MSQFLRPCVAMGTPSPDNGGFYGPWSTWAWNNPTHFVNSRTPWVRIWVSWKWLQPNQPWTDPATDTTPLDGIPPHGPYVWPAGNSFYTPQLYLYGVDGQIQEARKNGQRVILTFWEAPTWANSQWNDIGTRPPKRPHEYAPPWDVSTSSPWAGMVKYLATRYNKKAPNVGNRWVDFLELMNEPNQLWWPQVADKVDGAGHLHKWAARMLKTARTMTRNFTLNEPLLLGPAITDADDVRFETLPDGRRLALTTPFSTFMPGMLDVMRSIDLEDGLRTDDSFLAWSSHNYIDVKFDLEGADNRARRMRDILASRGWAGWRDGANNAMLITEGGVTPADAQARRTFQNRLVEKAWNRMHSGTPGASVNESVSIGMMANYLMWSSAPPSAPTDEFDVGLLDPPQCDVSTATCAPHAAPERAVFNVWKSLPTTFPR